MLKKKLNTLANKEFGLHSKTAIFISIISLFVFAIGACQNIKQDYLYNKILGCVPIAILLIVSVVLNFVNKRKLLCMMQLSLVIIEFIDLLFATGFSTMSHSYVKFFEMLFADYSAYIMTLIFLVDVFAIISVRYCNKFWYSLYAGLKVTLFTAVLIGMIFNEYILLYDTAFTVSYLLYYIAMLIISFDNKNKED